MDENKEKDKWYYSKRFTPILIFFAIAIICFASSRAANAPNLVIEQNVVDTQEYLPEGKGFFDTNNIGKRYKLLCRIIDDPEKIGTATFTHTWRICVRNTRYLTVLPSILP